MKSRLFAVDPSLTCSGWALFDIEPAVLLAVGKIRSLPPSAAFSVRLRDLQRKITSCLKSFALEGRDFLVCESQTTMRDPRAAFKVEQVRGIFETVARDNGVVVPGRVNPRSVQHELMGLKGQQLKREIVKDTATHTVRALYKEQLKALGFPTEMLQLMRHQDIVDAILVGSLAVSRVQAAWRTGLTPEEIFEAKTVSRFTRAKLQCT